MKAGLSAVAARLIIAAMSCWSAPVLADAVADDDIWTSRFDFIGDMRLRYEIVDEEFEAQKKQWRFRGRFGFKAQASEKVSVIMGLATGNDNPVSANQDIDGLSLRDVRLDLAYVDWRVNDSLSVNVGKMKNPLFRAGKVPLVWDSDLNPKGLTVKVSSGLFFGTAGGFLIEKRSANDDSMLYFAQGGMKLPIGESNRLTVGVGYFGYTNTIGNPGFYHGKAKGNTLDVDGNYVFEYKDTEVFAQLDTTIANWPLQLFAHYARNNEVSREDSAIAYGARLGSSKDKGHTQFVWVYQDIEADSVIGTFNDSDFGGGGTDSKGHIFKIEYGLSKKTFLGGTFFLNTVERFQGVEHDYSRIQLDVEYKFD